MSTLLPTICTFMYPSHIWLNYLPLWLIATIKQTLLFLKLKLYFYYIRKGQLLVYTKYFCRTYLHIFTCNSIVLHSLTWPRTSHSWFVDKNISALHTHRSEFDEPQVVIITLDFSRRLCNSWTWYFYCADGSKAQGHNRQQTYEREQIDYLSLRIEECPSITVFHKIMEPESQQNLALKVIPGEAGSRTDLTLLPNFGGFHGTLQRVRLANRGRLLLRTPGPVPFWTCICSNVETILSWTCHVYGPFEFRTSLGTSILLLSNLK